MAPLLALVKSLRRKLCCRLPLFVFWTLVVLVALHVVFFSARDQQPLPAAKLTYKRVDDELYNKKLANFDEDINTQTGSSNNKPEQSSTRKAPQHYRNAKVLVLLVQTDSMHSPRSSKNYVYPSEAPALWKENTRTIARSRRSHANLRQLSQSSTISQNNLSPNIRHVVDTLEAHKIDYAIETTRTGLPQALLDAQSLEQSSKQFSVIIIDDLIRYTRLSRWIRDQVDRFCRVNQIGVVAFFGETPGDNTYSESSNNDNNKTAHLLDQMPLAVRAIDHSQKSCYIDTKSSIGNMVGNKQSQCLLNYELNEKSPILRLIKSKPNFVLAGPLEENLNKAPWISMDSNHKTFEPLTYAHLETNSAFVTSLKFDKSINRLQHNVANLEDQFSSDKTEKRSDSDESWINLDQKEFNATPMLANIYLAVPDDDKMNKNDQGGDEQTDINIKSSSSERNETVQLKDIERLSDLKANNDERLVLSMVDNGSYDGIRRVIFGAGCHFWLHRALLLDAIEHLSGGSILSSLERFVQIDIDDIFVAETGKRMTKADVDALLDTQRLFSEQIEGGFQFNLGYSGKYFKHGSELENFGDEELVKRAHEFTWFCHTWSHSKAHLFNSSELIEEELIRNRLFALEHNLPLIGEPNNWRQLHLKQLQQQQQQQNATTTSQLEHLKQLKRIHQPFATYAVAPHHSGGKLQTIPVYSSIYVSSFVLFVG